ncbi:hypothetical protein ACLB2K_053998 [Fragaria x ananassa]
MNREEYFNPFILSKEVCEFETDPSIDANPTLQPSQVYKTSRPGPFLEEVAGQVYCFGGPSYSNSFEVFDRTQEKWLPLDVPPRKYPRPATVCHATVGNKIHGSKPSQKTALPSRKGIGDGTATAFLPSQQVAWPMLPATGTSRRYIVSDGSLRPQMPSLN